MDHIEHYNQQRRQWIATSIRYLNDVWLKMPDRLHNLKVRCLDGEYGYYDMDSGECKRIVSEDEIIEEAQAGRIIEWRRAYFKRVDGGIQCSICGEEFQSCSQHIAPCVQKDHESGGPTEPL